MRKLKRYLRRPKTTQERRASQDGWGRPCRNLHNLVHSWDDIWKPFQRSWKEYRKTQYKVKYGELMNKYTVVLTSNQYGENVENHMVYVESEDKKSAIRDAMNSVTQKLDTSDWCIEGSTFVFEGHINNI